MKLAYAEKTLETIGVEEEGDFLIKADGKAFRLLIDGLYSDKIGSLVREIAANAADSHIVAGQDKPFFINCPNDTRPEFFVRDYGVGMDHAKVMGLYTVLFESDKDQNNDVTGAFGLGRMTPFAYSDQFSVSCYDGAQVRHYACAISPSGRPKIMLMGTEPCDEPRGVRVTVAVEAKDFNAFKVATTQVAPGHDPIFEANISLGPCLADRPFVYKGEGWTCYDSEVAADLPGEYNVRQGCVIYSLDRGGKINTPSSQCQDSTGKYRRRRFLFEAEMGRVLVTGSREAIQFTPEVVDYLQAKIEAMKVEVQEQAWETVKEIRDLVDFHHAWKNARLGFMPEAMIHPFTGMTSTTYKLPSQTLLFVASLDTHRERWDFKTETNLNATSYRRKDADPVERAFAPKTLDPAPIHKVFWIKDYSAILDPVRDTVVNGSLSPSETRRFSRLVRAYMEKNGLTSQPGRFLMGDAIDETSWGYAFPHLERIEIAYEDLRAATPKRLHPVVAQDDKQPIRGLALAIKAGDQAPVTEIDFKAGDAWVSSDIYRRDAATLFTFVQRFGIERLYLVSPTVEQTVRDAQVPSLREAMDAYLAPRGLTFIDVYHMRSELSGYSNMTQFLGRLLEKAPEAYAKLERSKMPIAAVAQIQRPFHEHSMVEFSDKQQKVFKLLYENGPSAKSPMVTALDKAKSEYRNNYGNPTVRALGTLDELKQPEHLAAAVDMLLAMHKHFPLTLKVNR